MAGPLAAVGRHFGGRMLALSAWAGVFVTGGFTNGHRSFSVATNDTFAGPLPDYLKRWPGLTVREGDRLVPAPADDQTVARSYPEWPEKGRILRGTRVSIGTARLRRAVNEEVRIVHVVEVKAAGKQVYVMGPKAVLGEYVDGHLATAPVPARGDPLVPLDYDGKTIASPAVDYNFEITSYRFATPGIHRIVWRLGRWKSNELVVEVH